VPPSVHAYTTRPIAIQITSQPGQDEHQVERGEHQITAVRINTISPATMFGEVGVGDAV
jgi:hypothetical protein